MSYTFRKLVARGKVVPPKSVLTIDKEQADISWSFNFVPCSSSNYFWQSGNNKRTYDSQCQIRKQNELSNVVVSRLGRAGAAKSREHVGNTRAGVGPHFVSFPRFLRLGVWPKSEPASKLHYETHITWTHCHSGAWKGYCELNLPKAPEPRPRNLSVRVLLRGFRGSSVSSSSRALFCRRR